jgi:hypothetical protein
MATASFIRLVDFVNYRAGTQSVNDQIRPTNGNGNGQLTVKAFEKKTFAVGARSLSSCPYLAVDA